MKTNIINTVLIFFIFFFSLVSCSYAWEKAIWPFNTPKMVSKQICKNSKDWAIAAFHCYDQKSRKELIEELYYRRNYSIKNDTNYRLWHIIYFDEMEKYVKMVWKNPNINEKMAVEIIKNTCQMRREKIEKQLQKTNPKK